MIIGLLSIFMDLVISNVTFLFGTLSVIYLLFKIYENELNKSFYFIFVLYSLITNSIGINMFNFIIITTISRKYKCINDLSSFLLFIIVSSFIFNFNYFLLLSIINNKIYLSQLFNIFVINFPLNIFYSIILFELKIVLNSNNYKYRLLR